VTQEDNLQLRYAGALSTAVALYSYSGATRRLIHAIKYHRRADLTQRLIKQIDPVFALAAKNSRVALDRKHRLLSRIAAHNDLVVAVPPNPQLFRKRDMCHVSAIAAAIAKHYNMQQCVDALRRIDRRPAQSGLPEHMRGGLQSKHITYRGPLLSGARVLLVDDVVTTGATANACATVLVAHGALSVDLFAIAG